MFRQLPDGDGFDGEWMKESLSFLCKGRRFYGEKSLFQGCLLCSGRKVYDGRKQLAVCLYGR